MNQTPMPVALGARWRVPIASTLAVLTGSISLAIAVCASGQRGSTDVDRFLIAGAGVIAVLAAQLLPALGQGLALPKKCLCAGLWFVCVAYTLQGQAGFLLAAQERSGQARAEAVMKTSAVPPDRARDLPTILGEKARVTEQFAHGMPWPCTDTCTMRMQPRRVALEERLKALDAEADEAQDRRRRRVQVEVRAQQAQADVGGAHLATALGVTYGTTTGATALIFALILEGVGCFCWSLVLMSRTSADPACPEAVTEADFPADAGSHAEPTNGHEVAVTKQPSHENGAQSGVKRLDDDVTRVAEAVRDSMIPLTVAAVRVYLSCSQQRASEVRREVAALLVPAMAPD